MIDAVTVGATSTLVLSANVRAARRRVVLCNNSDEDMYACPGPVAISTAGIPLKAGGGAWTDQPDTTGYMYQGLYTAICASGGKVLSVTELP
ncbi:unnamed protein product [marine sediment metagenome]|uniref:Uncharacterized protein n=1 Tax=marine sediment metagenome TaxID=412755 RepID=X1KLE8_9ZZZZ